MFIILPGNFYDSLPSWKSSFRWSPDWWTPFRFFYVLKVCLFILSTQWSQIYLFRSLSQFLTFASWHGTPSWKLEKAGLLQNCGWRGCSWRMLWSHSWFTALFSGKTGNKPSLHNQRPFPDCVGSGLLTVGTDFQNVQKNLRNKLQQYPAMPP